MDCKRITKLIKTFSSRFRLLPADFNVGNIQPSLAIKREIEVETEAVLATIDWLAAKATTLGTIEGKRMKIRSINSGHSCFIDGTGQSMLYQFDSSTLQFLETDDGLPVEITKTLWELLGPQHPFANADIITESIQVSPDGTKAMMILENGIGNKGMFVLRREDNQVRLTGPLFEAGDLKGAYCFSEDSTKFVVLRGQELGVVEFHPGGKGNVKHHVPALYEKPKRIRLVNKEKGLIVEDGFCHYIDLESNKITHLINCNDSVYDETSGRYLQRSRHGIILSNIINEAKEDKDYGYLGNIFGEDGALAMSPDGRFMAHSDDRGTKPVVRVYELTENLPVIRAFELPNHVPFNALVQQIQFEGNNELVVLMTDGFVYKIERPKTNFRSTKSNMKSRTNAV